MKKLIQLLFLFNFYLVFGQEEITKIGEQEFEFQLSTSDPNEDVEKVTLSILPLNSKNPNLILKHTLKKKEHDSNSESLELGAFDISNKQLTLYSFWCWRGDAPVSPYGARILTYELNDTELVYKEGLIYLEKTRIDWPEIEGIKFLFEKPKTERDKQEYIRYIQEVEEEYDAKFIYGKKANDLLNKVKTRLQKEIQKETNGWHKFESSFGKKI